eukprot:TRINITY_DN13751_c0_g1_i1.p2 TRINITY_DN13751_c0_g1~~TRINITY_DN13751_c0_g1_i1.p2  ORF type:complete len:100 (+),score=14.46 TRINITY_DN13751_c0_g1_i1:44-343(+)
MSSPSGWPSGQTPQSTPYLQNPQTQIQKPQSLNPFLLPQPPIPPRPLQNPRYTLEKSLAYVPGLSLLDSPIQPDLSSNFPFAQTPLQPGHVGDPYVILF